MLLKNINISTNTIVQYNDEDKLQMWSDICPCNLAVRLFLFSLPSKAIYLTMWYYEADVYFIYDKINVMTK